MERRSPFARQGAYVPLGEGEKIRRGRRRLGMSQEEVAEEAGISVRTLSRAEHGELITRKTARQVARVLGIPVGEMARYMTYAELDALGGA